MCIRIKSCIYIRIRWLAYMYMYRLEEEILGSVKPGS